MIWEGFARAGYRAIQVIGNEDLFYQDVGLNDGVRLTDFQFAVKRPGEESIVRGEAYGLEDQLFESELETGRGLHDELGGVARFSKRKTLFAAGGDFHRRSRTTVDTSAAAFWDNDDSRLELSYAKRDLEGSTLWSRIGNPGQFPLDPVQMAVPAELEFEDDLWNLGWETGGNASAWSIDLGWTRHKQRESLAYDRPSPANPGFTESETASSTIEQEGPEAAASVMLGGEDPRSRRGC